MAGWSKVADKILTSKWNKPFPVTLLPSAIGAYVGAHFATAQGERQRQILNEIRALSEEDGKKVIEIAEHPR